MNNTTTLTYEQRTDTKVLAPENSFCIRHRIFRPLLPFADLPEMGTLIGDSDHFDSRRLESPPKDTFNLAYSIFFALGAGLLFPWNAIITAVDYFAFLYPSAHVDRTFSVAYLVPAFIFLLYLIVYGRYYSPKIRINVGLSMYLLCTISIPLMDGLFIKGGHGTNTTLGITIAAAALTGVGDALVQGSLVGFAGGLPNRYMQALVAGTAGSGVLVSFLRILTKAALPNNEEGLKRSANLYFFVGIAFMIICIISYNFVDRLPVMRYHKTQQYVIPESAHLLDDEGAQYMPGELDSLNTSTISDRFEVFKPVSYWEVLKKTQGLALCLVLIYVTTLTIFPGAVTEDVHSAYLGDWYSVLLVTCYNIGDLVGKAFTAYCLIQKSSILLWSCVIRVLFIPIFAGCLHGPHFLRTELAIFTLTSLLGITNGYLTSAVMIKAPQVVSSREIETTGIIMVVFLMAGLTAGSVLAWTWIL